MWRAGWGKASGGLWRPVFLAAFLRLRCGSLAQPARRVTMRSRDEANQLSLAQESK